MVHCILTEEIWVLSHALVEAHGTMVDDHIDVVVGSVGVWLSVEKLEHSQSMITSWEMKWITSLNCDKIKSEFVPCW